MDQFSRYVAAVPLPNKSARLVGNAIMTNGLACTEHLQQLGWIKEKNLIMPC